MLPPHSHSHSPHGDEYHSQLLDDIHGHSHDSDHGHVHHHHRPASTKVPVNFFIALLAVQLFVTPLFVFCRMYMLRKQRATIWSKIADWCFGIYGFLVIVDSGTMMNYVVEEKKLIEKFPGVQDEAKVLNEMLKKSHLVANFTLSLTYNIEMTIIKLAFLCYFFPLLPALRLRLRITLYLTTLYLLFTCVAQLLSTLLYCHPISLNWAAPPTCALENSFPGVILQFGINLSTSLLLLLLVLFILAQRLVTRYDKLGVGIIVIIGMLAPTMALLRVIAIWPLVQDGHVHMAELTRANSSYGVIEALAVMVAFFCPALRVWFRERVGDGASASPTGLMARSGVDVSKTTKGSRGNSGSTLPRWQGGTGLWRSTRNGSWDSTDQGAETEGELAARDDMNMGRGVREYVWNGQGRPPTWI